MFSDAQPWVSVREIRAREMTWTTAERIRWGQPRGNGREAYPYNKVGFPGGEPTRKNRWTTPPKPGILSEWRPSGSKMILNPRGR